MAALALIAMARGQAVLERRDFVTPEDVKAVAVPGAGAPDQPPARAVGPEGHLRRRRGRPAAVRRGAPLSTLPLTFTATPRPRRLAMVAGLAVAFAVATAHGELLVVAVVPLVLLALSPRSSAPESIEVTTALGSAPVRRGRRGHPRGAGRSRTEPTGWTPTRSCRRGRRRATPASTSRTVSGCCAGHWSPSRWGRHRVGPVRLVVHAGGGSYVARLQVDVGDLVVYPAAAALARAVAPHELAAPLGEHTSRAVGSGVEFAGVRPYAHGDRQRDVDWRTSARHGDLFVRQYAAERAFDLVLVLDTAVDAGEPGRSSLDLTVRAATGLAQTYLRSHDRVGLVTFGGPLRWLAPAAGPRQLFQVCEAVLAIRPDEGERDAGPVHYGLGHLPRGMLPHRAFVALLTPLLDEGPLEAVRLMRERGFAPLVVDVLNAEPQVRPAVPLGPSRPPDVADAARRPQGRAGGPWVSRCSTGTATPSSPAGCCTPCGRPDRGAGHGSERRVAGRPRLARAGSSRPRRPWSSWAPRVAVVAAVPDLDRYVVVLAALTVVAAVAAAVLPWRMTGTVTVLAATLTVLLRRHPRHLRRPAGPGGDGRRPPDAARGRPRRPRGPQQPEPARRVRRRCGRRRPARSPRSWRSGQVRSSPSRRRRTSYPRCRWSSPAWQPRWSPSSSRREPTAASAVWRDRYLMAHPGRGCDDRLPRRTGDARHSRPAGEREEDP